jgi:hypothetical protein
LEANKMPGASPDPQLNDGKRIRLTTLATCAG